MVRKGLAFLCLLLIAGTAATAAGQTAPAGAVAPYPVSQLRPGMKAVGYTVFVGDKIEAFSVEILGVMKNFYGPKHDIVLARLGDQVLKTGAAGGMSGSPVYLDGKLVGAVSLRIGMFTNEPIVGITPAEKMLEIKEIDQSKGAGASSATAEVKFPIPAEMQALLGVQSLDPATPDAFLTPIDTPLVFAGFHESVLRHFSHIFRQMGVTPVQGGAGGAVAGSKPTLDAEALKRALPPGSAVSGVLVSGDLSVSGLGTVTYNDGHRVLAFGHPFFNLGKVEMPMAKAEVVHVLGSSFAPVKLGNATEVVGALRQDRHSGILGVLGEAAPMIPVEAVVRSGNDTRSYKFEVFPHPKFTGLLLMISTFNSLFATNQYADDATYRVRGGIRLEGFPEVKMENLYASSEGPAGIPGPMALTLWVSERFTRIFNNPYETPKITGIKLNFEIIPERRTAVIEHVWAEKNEARPGETVEMKVLLRPYRGERLVKDVRVTIPPTAPKGEMRVLFSDAEVLNRSQNAMLATNRAPGLNQIISMMNREQANGQLYVTLYRPSPTAFFEDKVLPSIPSSVANVMDSGRIQNRLTYLNESSVQQASIPVDYVISGSQTVVVTVK